MDTSTNPDPKSQKTVGNCTTSGKPKPVTLIVTTPVGQLADYCCCGDIHLALPTNKERLLMHICGASLVRSFADGKIQICQQPNKATVPDVNEYVGPLLPEKKRFRTLKRSVKRHLEDRLVVKRGCCNPKTHEENILTPNPSKNQDEDTFSFPMPSEDHQSSKETIQYTENITEGDGHRRCQSKVNSPFPENYQLTFLNHLVSLYGYSQPRYTGPNISGDNNLPSNSFILNARDGLNQFKKETANGELKRTVNTSNHQKFNRAPGAERETNCKNNECADIEENPSKVHARRSTDSTHLQDERPMDRDEDLSVVDNDAPCNKTNSHSSITQKASNTFPLYANSTTSESFNFNTFWTPFNSNMSVHLVDNISHHSQWTGDKNMKIDNSKIDLAVIEQRCDSDNFPSNTAPSVSSVSQVLTGNAATQQADDQQSTTSESPRLLETTETVTSSSHPSIDVSKQGHSYPEQQVQDHTRSSKVSTGGNQILQDTPASSFSTSTMPLPSIGCANNTELTIEPVKYDIARKLPSLMDLRISPLPNTRFRSSSSDSIRPKPQYDISSARNPSRLKLPWDTYVTVKGSEICQIPFKEKPTSAQEPKNVRPTAPSEELHSNSVQVQTSTNLLTNQSDLIPSTEAAKEKHEKTTSNNPDSQMITSKLATCSTHEANQISQANISVVKNAKGKHNLKTSGSNSTPSVRRDSLAHSLRTNPMELKRTDVASQFSLETFVHNWSNTEPSAIYVNDKGVLSLVHPPQLMPHDSQDL